MAQNIYWAGDSTVAFNSFLSYPQTGIGQVMPIFVKNVCQVYNHAMNGRSTKSFINEGRFDEIINEIKEEDFLFIQFGHNDEKSEDPARYTAPFDDFASNLEFMIEKAREKKAIPVLITPLSRRKFADDGCTLLRTHGDYPEAVKQTGVKMNVPVIDLENISYDAITSLGDEESKKLFMHVPKGKYTYAPEGKTDDTHLQYTGAVFFAELIAKEIVKDMDTFGNLFTYEMIKLLKTT